MLNKLLNINRLNAFPILNNFGGNVQLLLAYKGDNYNIPMSKVNGADRITVETTDPIPGTIIDGQIVNVTIKTDNINPTEGGFQSWDIQVKYGLRGDQGTKGPVGLRGDQGKSALDDIEDTTEYIKIINNLLTDDSNSLLSAYQGTIINDFLKSHIEKYSSQESYESLSSKESDVIYYTYEETKPLTGNIFKIGQYFNWNDHKPTRPSGNGATINGNEILLHSNAKVNNNELIIDPSVAYVEGNTLVIKFKAPSNAAPIVGIEGNNNTLVLSNNIEIRGNEIVVPAGFTISNNELIIQK